jgi:hypothetical protein
MVDFLVSEKPSSDDATKLWQDYMRKLCNGLPDCVGKLGILHMLLCNGPMCQCTWHVEDCINLVLGNQNPMHDNFLAAVATKSYDKLRELFHSSGLTSSTTEVGPPHHVMVFSTAPTCDYDLS